MLVDPLALITPILLSSALAAEQDLPAADAILAKVESALGAADALGYGFVALLGSPAYYGRFGFVRSTDVGIEPPDRAWGAHFQERTLSAFDPAARGRFVYPAPFDAV